MQEQIPQDEYAKFAGQFNPTKYDSYAWALLAKEAGMKYMVLTTRHHDGFCLFDSQTTDFTAPKTAAKRDLIAEYVRGCRKTGLKVGFYYSLGNWQFDALFKHTAKGPQKDPKGWAAMVDQTHAQLRELCSNYGKIDLLWYDGGWGTAKDWRAKELNATVRSLQPQILINNRSNLPEDFDTPEQHLTASKPGRMWESCMTMNCHWGYFEADHEWKSTKQLVHNITACAAGAGNYLLNVGPKPDGSIPLESAKRLREIGEWMKVNGPAIYASQRCPLDSGTAGVFTQKGNKLYLIVHWWPGETLTLPKVPMEIKSASLLATRENVAFRRDGKRLVLTGLPKASPDPRSTVIVLERRTRATA